MEKITVTPYCKKTFRDVSPVVVNYYKCGQKPFSTPDLWNIQKRKKQVGRRALLT